MYLFFIKYIQIIDIKKVDKQLMHVKDRYVNGTLIDKLTKLHQ